MNYAKIIYKASIEKLKILGVRNFGIKSSETIFFEAPLTLIVGYNGSGKTTIIECLKYATTGTLPPNSKNGAFVHDPKLVAEKEVMAQVKLQFRNNSGNRQVVTRSLQVQLKKGGLPAQKTLECQLMTIANGQRTSMSKRVAELDKVIPIALGVSPAILDSVIFCHQDESLWPMSEPSVLKKKFDSIFEAEKYTKAVDNLKAMRKSKLAQGSLLKQAEDHARSNKDKAEKVKKQMEDLHTKIEELRVKAETLRQAMNDTKMVSDEKRSQAHEVLGFVDKLKNRKERARYLKENLDRLEVNLEEFQESDEWLKTTLGQYKEKMAQYEEQHRQYTSEYLELQQNIKNVREQSALKQAEQGRQQAAKDSYEESLKSRIELVKEAARNHQLRGYEGDLDEDHVQDFVDRIQKLSVEKDRELDRIKKNTEDELGKTQGILNELSTRRTTFTQEKVNAKQVITSNDRKVESKQQEVSRIKMDEGTKASLDASLLDAEGRLKQLKHDFEAADWDNILRAEKSQLRELETEQDRLGEESVQCTRLATSRAQLDYTKKQAKQLRSDLEIQKSTHNDRFRAVIGAHWDLANLESDYDAVIDRRTRDHKDAKDQQQRLAEELSEINMRLKTHQVTLVKKNAESEKCRSAVLASIINPDTDKPISSIDEYMTELEALKNEHDEFMKDFDGRNYISSYYRKAGEVVTSHNSCRLCERPFANQTERASAMDKINKLIAKYATETAEQERQHLSASWKKANGAKFQYDMYVSLANTEIPSLEKEIQKLENERTPLVKRLEHQDMEVNEKDVAKRDAELQQKNVNNLLTLVAQISQNDEAIVRHSSAQSLSGTSLSVDEIAEQTEACKGRILALRTKIAKLEKDRKSAETSLADLGIEAGHIREKARDAKYNMEKKQGHLSTIGELREHTSQQRDIIQNADQELEGLLPLVQKAEAQHADAKQRGRIREKQVQADKDKLVDTVNKFRLINRAINTYTESGGPGKLAACQRAIKTLDQDLGTMEIEQNAITQKNNELQKRIDDSDKTKRSMEDNLTCRQFRCDLENERREIAELASQDFQEKWDRLDEEANEANLRFQKATAERSATVGAMSTMDEQFKTLQQEWGTDYHDAAAVYRESHVKVATNTAACEDLAKFTRALDEAIMKFHTIKMQEINAVASELWRSTYQGTDVDTIMIRSETENAANKRAINYRLVMIKQDAEMDMRGRCSAGQRVLACIIIRLALAECFGVNCGVIALDEPTTNLDSDNIKALAISLNQIIHHRRHQKNFQLVIITHDEEFLKHMKCAEFTDNYYRVFRDVDQKSTIHRQPIGELAQ